MAGVLVGAALGLGGGGLAEAHEFRPGLLDVTALGGGRFEIGWAPSPEAEKVEVVFPEGCVREVAGSEDESGGEEGRAGGDGRTAAEGRRGNSAYSERRFVLDCGAAGMAGRSLSVRGLAPLRDEVLVRFRGGGGETTGMLTASRAVIEVPSLAGATAGGTGGRGGAATVKELAITGAGHLLTGPDHVLFVMGLLLLVRRRRALFWAITAFTAAHSLTLGLQVMGGVRLAPAPVEAAIALSVLLLAREIVRAPGEGTLSQRRPWAVAFGFGLLHGLGFAGGLSALGVPERQIPAALLGFNLGLEGAQLALVGAALGVTKVAGPVIARLPRWTHRAPAYGIGALAAFWTLQRVGAFLG